MTYSKDNTKLFQFIFDAVIDEGGDGDISVVVQLQDSNLVANQFFEWVVKNNPPDYQSWNINKRDNYVCVWRDMESFSFSDENIWSADVAAVEGKFRCSQLVITL